MSTNGQRMSARYKGLEFSLKASSTVVAVFLLAASMAASAATLGGTVTNATTGKPAAGDDVALLSLSQGMQEIARSKTDAQGKFSFSFESNGTPHMVRVTHDGVNYFPQGGPAGPNVSTVDLTVYDVAKNLPVSTTVDVMRVQSDSGALQVMQLIAVKNDSSPARTVNSDRGYAFSLPEGAQIDEAVAQAPSGMPVSSMPVPDDKQKGTYYFAFPLRPGETRFQLAYHLPYSGELTITPKIFGDMQHFVVMMPKSMSFEAKNPSAFSSMKDPQGGDALVEVSTQAKAGSDLSFRVKGTGLLKDEAEQGQTTAQGGQVGMQGGGAPDSRPGGGLGRPIDTPDPLSNYRWVILGALGVVLAGGGYLAVSRSKGAGAPAGETEVDQIVEEVEIPPKGVAPSAAVAVPASTAVTADRAPADRSQMILEALKEELFQLEIERQQGSISQADYEKAKSALDQTLQRALARKKSVTVS
jgi:5-hydroxyisourate hydrolase-like protein (transthyretin family)